MEEEIKRQFKESSEVKKKLIQLCAEELVVIICLIVATFKNGNKLLICGNGGSAADSQHIAAEFISSFRNGELRRSLPAIALTTDTSILTAYSNDYGFEGVFGRQVEGLGSSGDLLLVLSTSGNSKNIVQAVNVAKTKGILTVGLLGKDGGLLKGLLDHSIVVPSDETARIQEGHMTIYHIICDLVEKKLFNNM